jgi:phosphoglucomutase
LKLQKRLPQKGVIISTIVTSPLVSKMAKENGLNAIEVLTGFKWIRQAALRFEKEQGGKFVFGMEESHGFLMGNHSGDKDGIWASMAFAEMAAALKENKLTPIDRLNQIYQQYEVHLDALGTQTFKGTKGMAKIQQIMRELRNSPPESVAGQAVVKITDYLENKIICGNETRQGPGLPQSNVIALELADNSRITARPSGTEPKIKYYFNLQGKDSEMLNRRLASIQADFIKD